MNPGEIDNMWTKLGFSIDDKGKHVKARLWVNKKLVVSTRRSHGAKATDGLLPQFIRQQMRLNEGQFADALNCPMDRPAYFDLLKKKGLL